MLTAPGRPFRRHRRDNNLTYYRSSGGFAGRPRLGYNARFPLASPLPGDRARRRAEDLKENSMTDILLEVEKPALKTNLPDFAPGDAIRVHVKVREGEKERIQVFAGVVIARRGGGARETFTVRKVSSGIGVERVFPLHSPVVDRIEVERKGSVRRAKLYYLRGRKGKAARIDEKRTDEKREAAKLPVEDRA